MLQVELLLFSYNQFPSLIIQLPETKVSKKAHISAIAKTQNKIPTPNKNHPVHPSKTTVTGKIFIVCKWRSSTPPAAPPPFERVELSCRREIWFENANCPSLLSSRLKVKIASTTKNRDMQKNKNGKVVVGVILERGYKNIRGYIL